MNELKVGTVLLHRVEARAGRSCSNAHTLLSSDWLLATGDAGFFASLMAASWTAATGEPGYLP